jgi:hypothetical protein
MKDTIYRWVHYDGQKLHGVGIRQDGSLVNPNHYSRRCRARRCDRGQ